MLAAVGRLACAGAGALAAAAAAVTAYRCYRAGWLPRRLLFCRANCALDPLATLGSLDVEPLQQQLCDDGFAVIDGVVGLDAVRHIREEVARLDRAGRMRVGRVLHGAELSTSDVRSDRIIFLSAGGEGAPAGASACSSDEDGTRGLQEGFPPASTDAPTPPYGPTTEATGLLRNYIRAVDRLRERLGSSAALTQRVGGGLDGCTAMCAIYPGGGSRYVKHRDALPYRAGRKLTAILYLNEGWEREHGGELRLWPEGGSRCAAGVGALSSGEGAMKGGGASSSRQGAMSRRDGAMNSGKGVAEPLKPLVVAPLADRLIIFISSLQHEVLPSWADRFALTTWMHNRRDTALESVAERLRAGKAKGNFDAKALLAAMDAEAEEEDGEDQSESDDVTTAPPTRHRAPLRLVS